MSNFDVFLGIELRNIHYSTDFHIALHSMHQIAASYLSLDAINTEKSSKFVRPFFQF